MKNFAVIQQMSEEEMILFLQNNPEEMVRNDYCANICPLRRKYGSPLCEDTGCTQSDDDVFRSWLRAESKLLSKKKGV